MWDSTSCLLRWKPRSRRYATKKRLPERSCANTTPMLLLYCVTESVATEQMLGVHGNSISTIAHNGVLCYCSEWSERKSDDAQQDALAYWSVVNRLFQETAVIPFRFPTFMKDHSAMEEFLS